MPPKRGKKESKRTLYHILGNLDEFVPPTNCHAASLEDLLNESSSSDGGGRRDFDEEDPLTDSNTPAHSGSPFGRSLSPLSPTARSADPLTARGGKRGGGKRGRDDDVASPPTPATIVFGGATAERKWGGKSSIEEPASSDSPMFLTELGMRERVAQRNLESTLYFAESVGNSKEIAPLKEFVDWVDGIGVARHLQDIRHMGQLQQLHTLLVGKPFSARLSTTRKSHPVENVAKCHALLLFYLCHQAPLEVVTCPEQFTFLVDLLGQFSCPAELAKEGSGSPCMSFPAPPQLPPKKQSHWSALLSKGKKATPATPDISSPLTPTPSSGGDDSQLPQVADTSEQSVWSTIRNWIRNTAGSTGDTLPMMVSDASILTIVLDTLLFITLGSNRRSLMTDAGGAMDPSAQLFGEEGAEDGGGESQFDSQLSASHMLASMSTDSFSASHQGAITKPGGLLFVGAGGLEVSLRLLNVLHSQERSALGVEEGSQYNIQSEAPELSKMIQLLEAVSCCEDLRHQLSAHQPLSSILVKLFQMLPSSEGCSANNDIYLRRIRVCLNISSVSPQSVPVDDARCDQMGAYLASIFQSSSIVDIEDEDRSKLELCSATVCLIVNLLKRGSNDTMRWSLLHSLNGTFALVAAEVAQRYYSQEGDVSMSVTAGYLAVMLGMLSLGDQDARVTVVTALMNGASESVQTVKHKPMLWIIAILQEFIMFQSTAQILTKNTVVTLTTVVDTLMVENGISVGDGSATPPE